MNFRFDLVSIEIDWIFLNNHQHHHHQQVATVNDFKEIKSAPPTFLLTSSRFECEFELVISIWSMLNVELVMLHSKAYAFKRREWEWATPLESINVDGVRLWLYLLFFSVIPWIIIILFIQWACAIGGIIYQPDVHVHIRFLFKFRLQTSATNVVV